LIEAYGMQRIDAALAQWRRERPDLDPSWNALLGRITDAAEIVMRDVLNPLFAGADLQPGEFDVLAALRRAGAPFTLSPTALCQTAMLSSGAMTNRIDRLEAAGLVERRPDPKDRRGRLVALTARGRAVIEEVIAAHVANEQRAVAVLSPEERRELARLLGKLVEGLPPRG
jgi:DNA-binding MarR family transcriptional regulator